MSARKNSSAAPAVRDSDYAYAVARIRANEVRLLTRQDLDGLLLSGSAENCLARLAEKGWGGGIRRGDSGSGEQTEGQMLGAEYGKTWALIEELAPDMSVFRFMTVKNDYHNLKAALKARLAGTGWQHMRITPCAVSQEDMTRAVNEKEFGLLPGDMPEAADEAYDALVTWVDGQLCEMILDRAALEASLKEAKKQGGLAEKLAALDVFSADMRIAYRSAAMKKTAAAIQRSLAAYPGLDIKQTSWKAAEGVGALVEYIADIDRDASEALEKGLGQFEKLTDLRRERLLEQHKYDTLGAAPLITYIVRRESEIANVRLVLAGLRNGVDAERIRAMLQ